MDKQTPQPKKQESRPQDIDKTDEQAFQTSEWGLTQAALRRTQQPPNALTPQGILQLQRTIGNQAVQRMLGKQPTKKQNQPLVKPSNALAPNVIQAVRFWHNGVLHDLPGDMPPPWYGYDWIWYGGVFYSLADWSRVDPVTQPYGMPWRYGTPVPVAMPAAAANSNLPVETEAPRATLPAAVSSSLPRESSERRETPAAVSSSSLPRASSRQWEFGGGFWTDQTSGMMYFPPKEGTRTQKERKEQLTTSDGIPVKDATILNEIRAIHAAQGEQPEKQEKKRQPLALRRRFSVDEYIAARFRVERKGTVVEFYDKRTGKLAGQISYYNKGKAISFDLNKFEKQEGEYSGISYLLVYYLMKEVALSEGFKEVQIEAFDSGRGTGGLTGLYQSMGLNAGMHGFVEEVMNQCELKAKAKFDQ